MSGAPRLVGPYERLMLLKGLSPSGDPPIDALGALAEQGLERRFGAGAVVIAADRPWDGVHIVMDGQVGVYESGREIYKAGPRETFGLMETVARVHGGVEARAEVETATLEITAATLFSVLEDHQVMRWNLVQTFSRMLLAMPASLSRNITSRLPQSAMAPHDLVDVVDRLRLLRASDLFTHARMYSLGEIALRFKEFRAQADTVLWREDDPAPWFMLLLDGGIESRSNTGLHFSWRTGTVPGVFEALAAAPRWHDAKAVSAVTGLRLDAEDCFDALEDDFSMAEDLLAALAARVRDLRHGQPINPATSG